MAVPAVAVLLVAATGFTAYVLTRTEPSHLESIGCYESAALEANVAVIGSDSGDPVASCREAWRTGAFSGVVPDHLVACVLQTGAIGVFPGSAACGRLGLAPLSDTGLGASKRFATLRNAIVARVGVPASGSTRGSGLCVGEARARAIVREELDAHGYPGWRIEVGGGTFSDQEPCADVSFDTAERVVILIPSAR
jgi:hypothetical protein